MIKDIIEQIMNLNWFSIACIILIAWGLIAARRVRK